MGLPWRVIIACVWPNTCQWSCWWARRPNSLGGCFGECQKGSENRVLAIVVKNCVSLVLFEACLARKIAPILKFSMEIEVFSWVVLLLLRVSHPKRETFRKVAKRRWFRGSTHRLQRSSLPCLWIFLEPCNSRSRKWISSCLWATFAQQGQNLQFSRSFGQKWRNFPISNRGVSLVVRACISLLPKSAACSI